MTLQESSIYIGLLKLRKVLYSAQFVMDKTNRVVYGTPMMQSLRAAMGHYVVAFEVQDKMERAKLMSLCIGEFANVRMDLDFMRDENMFHFKKRRRERFEFKVKDANGRTLPNPPLTAEERLDDQRYECNKWVEIYTIVASIEADIRKYYNSISRGKTIVG